MWHCLPPAVLSWIMTVSKSPCCSRPGSTRRLPTVVTSTGSSPSRKRSPRADKHCARIFLLAELQRVLGRLQIVLGDEGGLNLHRLERRAAAQVPGHRLKRGADLGSRL